MRKSLFFNLRRLQAQIGADGALTSEATATIARRLRASPDAVESMAIRLGARDQSTNAPSGEGDDRAWCEAISREPTPEQAATMAEIVECLLARLEADERIMLEMSLQGFSAQDISEQTGRAERSVRRLRERVRKHLQSQHAATSDS